MSLVSLVPYPLKTSENLWLSVYRRHIKRLVAWNGLNWEINPIFTIRSFYVKHFTKKGIINLYAVLLKVSIKLHRYTGMYSETWQTYMGQSKICRRQPLKNLKGYGLLKQTISLQVFQRLFSTNFTWSILEYLDSCKDDRFWKKVHCF